MASGKQSKRGRREAQQMAVPHGRRRSAPQPQPRRSPPKVQAPAPAQKRRASTKVLVIAAGVVALIALGVGLFAVFSGGSSSATGSVPDRGSLRNALPGAAEVQQLFAGIPQRGGTLGPPDAPVTLVEYVDIQCPFCREYASGMLPTLVHRYVRTGKVRIESRPVARLGPDSLRGQQAVLAAGEQGKSFNLMQLLYFNQGPENTGWLTDDLLTAATASIPGVNVPELLDARETPAVAGKAQAVEEEAQADGVHATPTLLVGPTGGELRRVELSSATDLAAIQAAIAKAQR